MYNRTLGLSLALIATIGLSGCATHISLPSAPIVASKQRLGSYQLVEMKPVSISPKFAGSGANQKAARKINSIMQERMSIAMPGLKVLADGQGFSAKGKVLQIEPQIEEIKFIGGAARFWVGAMAGSSAVLMKVTYRDAASGEVLAQPEFYRVGSAFSGALSMGGADNLMLEEVAQDAVAYASNNR